LILSNRVSFALNMAEIKYWWKYKSRINIFKLKLKKENRTNDAAIEQFNWFAKHNKQQFTAKNEINNLIAKKDKIKKTNWFIYFMPVLVTV
jgi:hypothetical protein